jgi:excinuclease UvrABC ATPase subunit
MNNSDKTRTNRLMTNIADGYLERLDEITKSKGLRGRNATIEYLIDKEPKTEEEAKVKIKIIDSQLELNENERKRLLQQKEELLKSGDAFKIVNKIEEKRKQQLLTNLRRLLQIMKEEGSSDDEILNRSVQFSQDNHLSLTICLEVGNSITTSCFGV